MEEPKSVFGESLKAGDMIIKSSSGGDFEDYVKLEAGEPLKAHVVDVKPGEKLFKGELQPKLFVYFELDEGDGKGQRYRGDFNPTLTSPSSPKQSNLSKFAALLYGEGVTEVDPADFIGRPIRILLSEEWGDKHLQFVNDYLKPAPDQRKVEVEAKPAQPSAEGKVTDAVDVAEFADLL